MYIKMKHRIAFMVMVVAMMIVAFAVCTSAASEKFEMSVELSNSTGASMTNGALVKKDDEFTVTVKINKNPGIISAMVDLKFDPAVVQPTSNDPTFEKEFTAVEDANSEIVVNSGYIRYTLWPLFDETKETGDLFSFKFKVVGASEVTAESAFSLVIADNFLINNDMDIVESETSGATVKLHNKHNEKTNDAIPATCYSEGWTEEIVCLDCGHVIEARKSTGTLDHNFQVTVPAQLATCMAPGVTEGKKCVNAGCTEKIDSVVDPQKPHKLVNVDAKAPTCTEMGYSAYSKCTNEGCVYKDGYVEKDPLNHVGTIVDVSGKEATATETGLTAGKQCYACQTWIQPQQEIPAKGVEPESSFPWVVVVIIVAVVAVAAVVVVYFTVIKKKNYRDDMFDDDDDEE